MRNNLANILLILAIIALPFSCIKDDFANDNVPVEFNPFLHNFVVDNTYTFDRDIVFDIDRVKIALSISLTNLIQDNNQIDVSDIKELINENNGRILAVNFAEIRIGEATLLDLFVENLAPEDTDIEEVIQNICQFYPHISIGLPLWVESIPTDVVSEAEWVVFPAVRIRPENLWRGFRLSDGAGITQGNSKPFEFIPLQIKEAEDLIPYREGDLTTIWDDHLVENHFPTLKECEKIMSAIPDFSLNFPCSQEYKFLEIFPFRDHLRNSCFMQVDEICFNGIDDDGDGLIDEQDPDCEEATPFEICNNGIDDDGDGLIDADDDNCECNPICERDCNDEVNAINRIISLREATFNGISNQPGWEDYLSFHYTFSSAIMCGDLNFDSSCPAYIWKKIFHASFDDFFELQEQGGIPKDFTENLGVLFFDEKTNRQWKLNGLDFEIPVFSDEGGVLAQASYLDSDIGRSFNGDVYGDNISFDIQEHDNLIVDQVIIKTIELPNVSLVSLSLQTAGQVQPRDESYSSFTFTDVVRASSVNLENVTFRDVSLGQSSLNYCDPNFTNDVVGFGITASTGSLSTVFAFY